MTGRAIAVGIAIALSSAIFFAARRYHPDDAPYRPRDDGEVLEHLAAGGAPPDELRGLEAQLARAPDDPALAAEVAGRHVAAARSTGDARRLAYAEAALQPWWNSAAPPVPVRLARAAIRQQRRELDAALADLDVVTREVPGEAQAWLARAQILTAIDRYDEARASCAHLSRPLIAAACSAMAETLSGRGEATRARLSALLDAVDAGPSSEKTQARRARGEVALLLGDTVLAETDLRAVISADPEDAMARGLLADLLLDGGRPTEVLALIASDEPNEALVLRRAIAARATGAPDAASLRARLAQFASELAGRGDTTHLREEARRLLVLEERAQEATTTAARNFAIVREPWDARLLLESAAALAHDPAQASAARTAAAPALAWQARTHCAWPPLARAARALEAP